MNERLKLLKRIDKLRRELGIDGGGEQWCGEDLLKERIKELEKRLEATKENRPK